MPASLRRSDPRDAAVRAHAEGDDILVLDLEGELDLASAPMLGEELDRALERDLDLILDLSGATFIDSSVIRELFRAAQAAERNGRTAVLQIGTVPLVERALEIVGIEKVLPRAHRRQEAIEIIRRRSAIE